MRRFFSAFIGIAILFGCTLYYFPQYLPQELLPASQKVRYWVKELERFIWPEPEQSPDTLSYDGIRAMTKMIILCIGDSNTYGYDPRSYFGSSYPDNICWTNRLAVEEAINCGINGLTVPTDSGPWQNLIDEKQPDLVVVMLGTNDLLEGRSAEIVSTQMENYLKELQKTGEPILLIAPPPLKPGAWVEDESKITESRRLGVLYRDICERLDMDFADAGDWNVELSFDGVHFTEYGHAAFAKGLQDHLSRREQ